MKLNNYFLPALLAGFAASVLTTVPLIKNFTCCLIIPLGGFFAVYLFKSASKKDILEFRHAALLGVLAGVFAAVFSTSFEVLMTYITRTNDFVESLPATEIAMKQFNLGPIFDSTFGLMRQMSKEIQASGFSLFFSIGMLFSNLVVDIIFSFVGGVLARSYFNRKAVNL